MADYSLQGLNISPEEFVGSLASPHENVCLRIISDRAGTGFSGQNRITYYARVSTDKDEQLHSLSAQVRYYSEFFQNNTN